MLIRGESFCADTLEIYNYCVDFLFIPSVDLTMKISPVTYGGKQAEQLQFYTKTKKVFSAFFAVNNMYESVYDPQDFSILYSRKIVDQPNVKQTFTTRYSQTVAEYSNQKSILIPKNTHNFFSLLTHLRKLDVRQIEIFHFPVEIEGRLFESRMKYLGEEKLFVSKKNIETDKIEITLAPMYTDQMSVNPLTDVFYWKVGSPEGKKTVWIEKGGRRRIIRSDFYLSLTWLTARLLDDEK